MKKKSEEKYSDMKIKKLEVRSVNKALWNKFKALVVAENEGKMRGILGSAMDEALSLFIDSREGVGDFSSRKDTHTQREKKVRSKSKIRDKEIIMPENPNQQTPRERRLAEIGINLFGNQITAIEREEEDFCMSKKGLKRLIIMQSISEDRVIKDYIRVLELKGWIETRAGRYAILHSKIADDLDLEYPKGYIEKLMERRKLEDRNEKEGTKT